MSFQERLNIIKSVFTGLPGQSLLTMAQRFTPMYGEPPRRSAGDWIDLYNKSPRLNPVHQIASDVATSAYGIYNNTDPKKIKIPNSQIEKLLKKPNSNLTITEYVLFYITEVYLLMPPGEAFWVLEKNGLTKPSEAWPVPPNWVLSIPSSSNPYYMIYPQGNMQASAIPVLPEDVVYFKRPDVRNPYLRGMGRVEQIGDELETDEYMAKFAKKYFFNGAVPDMVGMMPGASKEEIDRTEELWNTKYGGFNNQHKTGFLNWDAKFQILKETSKEMDYVNSRKYLRDTANQHFCIPPELLGILENSNRSTINSAYFLYAKNVLRKELKFIGDTLNLQLVSKFADDIYFEFDNVVPADDEFELKKASEGLKNGGITVNEWRRTNGWEDLPGDKGEIMYTPLNMIPTSITGDGPLPTNIPPVAPEPPPPEVGKKKGLTPEHKQAIWKVFDRAAVKNERPFINALKKYFQSQQDRVNASLSKSVKALDPDDILNWGEESGKLKATLNPLWMASLTEGYDFAESTFGFGISFDVVNPKFKTWIEKEGLERSKIINDTTKGKLRTTLSEGIMEGESIPKLRDRVASVYEDAKGYRATLISRTETTTTVNSGALDTYRAAKIEKKEWLATLDNRVRPEHEDMNGEVVGIDEPFSNGSMSPDEPNCRCTVLPVISDEVSPVNPPGEGFTPASTINEAQQWARDVRLAEEVDYSGMHIDAANKINNQLYELSSGHKAMTGKISRIETFNGTEMDGAAVYSADDNLLRFNNFVFGKADADDILKSYQQNFVVEASVKGTVKHEFGHASWSNLLTETEQKKIRVELTSLLRTNRKEIERELSKYALSNAQGMEVVSEMFNAKLNGATFASGQLAKIDKALSPLWKKLGLR